MKIVPN